MPHIGILLFDGFEELDALGPWEVLATWSQDLPEDGWTVSTFTRDGAPVRAAKGLLITPDHSYDSLPHLAVLLYPGGQGTRAHLEDAEQLQWIRDQRDAGTLMTSVCTGSTVYAAAGLLRDRPATTYWGSLDRLATIDPTIEVRPDDRFVDSGEVVTASGVSAGIDMALHLVSRLHSVERARDVRRYIQYDPEPPV